MSLMFPSIYGIVLGDLTEEQSKVGFAAFIMSIVRAAFMQNLRALVLI